MPRQPEEMAILIVDDSPHIHNQLQVILNADGFFNLSLADSAAAAFRILGLVEPAEPARAIDLILMDIEMDELNGIEATRRIKAMPNLCDIPVLMITADTSQESLQEAFRAGAVDYITKPIRKLELLARVRSFLQLKTETDTRKAREEEKAKLIVELQKALDEIKILQGIIPICSYCKKIRDDEGIWSQLEAYIHAHSEAVFSHGLCPDCMKEKYPDEYKALSSEND